VPPGLSINELFDQIEALDASPRQRIPPKSPAFAQLMLGRMVANIVAAMLTLRANVMALETIRSTRRWATAIVPNPADAMANSSAPTKIE
jgi:hypothetical protein